MPDVITTENWKEKLLPEFEKMLEPLKKNPVAVTNGGNEPSLLEQLAEALKNDPKGCLKVRAALTQCDEDAPVTKKDLEKYFQEKCQGARRQPSGASSSAQSPPYDVNRAAASLANMFASMWLACLFPGLMFNRTLN
jgi:hypothetical protein